MCYRIYICIDITFVCMCVYTVLLLLLKPCCDVWMDSSSSCTTCPHLALIYVFLVLRHWGLTQGQQERVPSVSCCCCPICLFGNSFSSSPTLSCLLPIALGLGPAPRQSAL